MQIEISGLITQGIQIWHADFAAGEDGHYNDLVVADSEEAVYELIAQRNPDLRVDVPFLMSPVEIKNGKVVELTPRSIECSEDAEGKKYVMTFNTEAFMKE